MASKVPKMKLSDKLHHGFVYTCMGITVLGFMNLAYQGYIYAVHVRPARKLREAEIERELLAEGASLASPAGDNIAA